MRVAFTIYYNLSLNNRDTARIKHLLLYGDQRLPLSPHDDVVDGDVDELHEKSNESHESEADGKGLSV